VVSPDMDQIWDAPPPQAVFVLRGEGGTFLLTDNLTLS